MPLYPGYPDVVWTDWSPTLTNLTLGNGSVLAKYQRIGRVIFYRFQFTYGSSGSAVGTNPQFSLPVAAAAGNGDTDVFGDCNYKDTGTANYRGQAWFVSATTARIVYFPAGGAAANVTATAPHTWASTDVIYVTGFYEAA